jgi:hypothetical protein
VPIPKNVIYFYHEDHEGHEDLNPSWFKNKTGSSYFMHVPKG